MDTTHNDAVYPHIIVDGNNQACCSRRPAIALNRDEQIVHVAFVELDDYRGGSIFNTVNDGDLYWDRRSYTACP